MAASLVSQCDIFSEKCRLSTIEEDTQHGPWPPRACAYMTVPSQPHKHAQEANASRMQFGSCLGYISLFLFYFLSIFVGGGGGFSRQELSA